MTGEHKADPREVDATLSVKPRRIPEEQMRQLEGHAAEILRALGMDLNTPSTVETPRRFIQALYDATDGYEGDAKLIKAFDTECRGGSDCQLSQIVEGPIPFIALCEHHALPFYGLAYIGYIPHEHIVGISKLTRLVRIFSRRFAIHERIGRQIADCLDAMMQPHGVAVYLKAHHLCVKMRGVRETTAATRTTNWRGEYEKNAALREEFFIACGLRR